MFVKALLEAALNKVFTKKGRICESKISIDQLQKANWIALIQKDDFSISYECLQRSSYFPTNWSSILDNEAKLPFAFCCFTKIR